MNRRLIVSSLVILALISACSTMQMGSTAASTEATGSAAGSTSQGVNSALQHCARPLGTVEIYEHTNDPWYYTLTNQYHLPSVTPLINLIVQQSNCFMVVTRGQGLAASMRERTLAQSGELRNNSNFHKGQLVAADYTLVPSVNISNRNAGGLGAILGEISPVAGFFAAGVHAKDADTTLLLDDNRSSVQVAAATGSARNFDFSGFGALFGGFVGGGVGAYENTAQGKVIVAAFVNAYNNLVIAVRNYRAQHIQGGPGTGGSLKVQGESPSSP